MNPFNDNVIIEFNDGQIADEINIINFQGKLVDIYALINIKR